MVLKRSLKENPFGPAEDRPEDAPRPPSRRPHAPRRQAHESASVRFTPAEEKRALILAHAERRVDVDPVQRWSLALGVGVCVIAVGIGWAYAMRESIVHAFQSPVAGTMQELDVSAPAARVADELNVIMKEVEILKKKQAERVRTLQEAEARLGSMPAAATSSKDGLFRALRASDAAPSVPEKPTFELPPGAEPDVK